MSWVDLVLLVLLGVSILVGLLRGVTFEVMSLLGWVVAYFAAYWFSTEAAPYVPIGNRGTALNYAATFASIFVGASIIWALGTRLIRMLIQASPLSAIDRLLGGVFGLIRGAVVMLVIATVVNLTPLMKSNEWQTSVGAPWLNGALKGLRPLLPPQLAQHLPA